MLETEDANFLVRCDIIARRADDSIIIIIIVSHSGESS